MNDYYMWQIKTPDDETYLINCLGFAGCTYQQFEYCPQCGLLSCILGNCNDSNGNPTSGVSFNERHDLCNNCVGAYRRSPELINWVEAFIRQMNWRKAEEEAKEHEECSTD